MSRTFTPKVLTANDLLAGDVIYFTAQGDWSRAHRDALLFEDQEQAETELARAETKPLIVGPYLADAVADDGGPTPVHFRETFRSRGPSNYAHGKQEAQENV